VAYENSGLRRSETQNSLIIKIIRTGCLRSLKIDVWFATQRRVEDDALQVIVSLKKNAQCFVRS